MSLLRIPLAFVPVLVVLGCGSISIDADGVDDFTPQSQIWEVETTSGANRHSFLLTNIGDYCVKKQRAEQDRIDADARHQERLDGGAGVCQSEDQRLDDLADAYGPLERDGAARLIVMIDREDESSWDGRTAPSAGEYRQVGTAASGRFTGQMIQLGGKLQQNRAEAYTCLSPEEVDIENFTEFTTEVEPSLYQTWDLSAGILEVEAAGDEAWEVDVSGDLMSGSATIGSLEASFRGKRCEVAVTADSLPDA